MSITYPDGYVLTYNYASGINDDISRLSHLSDTGGTLEEYDYLGSGTVVRRAHPQPGVDMTLIGAPGAGGDQYAGLDQFGRVVDLLWVKTSGPTALEHIQHSYDLLGNRLTRDNLVNSAFDEVYAYDDLSQLVNFARGAHTQDWDYDALGNWNSVTTNGGSPETRTHDAQNQITSISGATTPAFDANGNMTGDETGRGFVYDAWNRLVEVKSGSTVLMTYRYDGLNRRVSADDGTDVTDLYYSNQWQVLEERVNGNVYAHYVWSPVYVDAMILRDRSVGGGTLNERLYVVQDANFNITALVNTSGNVVERYAYTPFGVRIVYDGSYNVLGSSAYDFHHGFQGMLYDPMAGFNFTHTRPYSPTLGRFTGPDWIRFGGRDVNFYRMEFNNPLAFTDPVGTDPKPFTRTGIDKPLTFDPSKGKYNLGETAGEIEYLFGEGLHRLWGRPPFDDPSDQNKCFQIAEWMLALGRSIASRAQEDLKHVDGAIARLNAPVGGGIDAVPGAMNQYGHMWRTIREIQLFDRLRNLYIEKCGSTPKEVDSQVRVYLRHFTPLQEKWHAAYNTLETRLVEVLRNEEAKRLARIVTVPANQPSMRAITAEQARISQYNEAERRANDARMYTFLTGKPHPLYHRDNSIRIIWGEPSHGHPAPVPPVRVRVPAK